MNTQSTRWIHRAASLVALVAIVLPAAAQYQRGSEDDDEYRGHNADVREAYRRGYERGYDRGYRKAAEEGNRYSPPIVVAPPPPAPPPNQPTGPINVTGAYYGSSDKNCQAGRYMARAANGKRSYSFKVTNEICGDPHPGARKSLEVTYTCGHLQRAASAREHTTIYLDCAN